MSRENITLVILKLGFESEDNYTYSNMSNLHCDGGGFSERS